MKIALFNIISSDDAICKHIVAVISNGFPVYPIYFAHRTLFPVIIIIIYPAVCFAILSNFRNIAKDAVFVQILGFIFSSSSRVSVGGGIFSYSFSVRPRAR